MNRGGAINKLEKLFDLGYLKFVKEEDILRVKEEIIKKFLETKRLDSDNDEDLNRYFLADGECLAEDSWYFEEVFKKITEVLSKEGVVIQEIKEEMFAGECRNIKCTLTVNGKTYPIFDEKSDYGILWSISSFRLLEILNELLINALSSERIYSRNLGGNSNRIVFLTPDLYEEIKKIADPKWCPQSIDEVRKVYKVS